MSLVPNIHRIPEQKENTRSQRENVRKFQCGQMLRSVFVQDAENCDLCFQPSKHAPHHGSKPGTQQRDRSISSVSVHSSGRPKSSLSTLTDKGTPEPAIEEVSEEPSPLEQQMQYEEQVR